MRKELIAAIFLACGGVNAGAVTLDEVQQRFSHTPVVRVDFTQERHIKDMGQTLRSSGSLIVAQELGLWWRQEKPFPLTLVIDEKRMVQVIGDQPPHIVTADSNPQMFQFNSVLRALFRADREVLEQNFSLAFKDAGDGGWSLTLTPKAPPLALLFCEIELRGSEQLVHIRLDDRQGDSTEISFSNHRVHPAALTRDEERRFAF